MSPTLIEILEDITAKYKNMTYNELSSIGKSNNTNVDKYYKHYKGEKFWVEVERDERISGIVRIMVEVVPPGMFGTLHGVVKYFGKTSAGEIIDNDSMMF
jgi:hypothetical protein